MKTYEVHYHDEKGFGDYEREHTKQGAMAVAKVLRKRQGIKNVRVLVQIDPNPNTENEPDPQPAEPNPPTI